MTLTERITDRIVGLVCEHAACRPLLRNESWVDACTAEIEADLVSYCRRDPASRGREHPVLESSTSFAAVFHYRIAHRFMALGSARGEEAAFLVSGIGKRVSGVEIHPGARIGARLVVDHGIGTVIGETVEIGDDCYILGGVTLGATGIAGNASGKRHPTIGDRVEIGKDAIVVGNIAIGDDCFIGSNCVVTTDMPAGSRVTVTNSIQVLRAGTSGERLGGVIRIAPDRLLLSCPGVTNPEFFLGTASGDRVAPLRAEPYPHLDGCCVVHIDALPQAAQGAPRAHFICEASGRFMIAL